MTDAITLRSLLLSAHVAVGQGPLVSVADIFSAALML